MISIYISHFINNNNKCFVKSFLLLDSDIIAFLLPDNHFNELDVVNLDT